MHPRRPAALGWLATFALAVALAGCSSVDRDEAAAVAQRFEAAARTDAALACGLLAPKARSAVAEQADGDCPRGLQAALTGQPAHQQAARDTSPADLRVEVAGQSAYAVTGGDVVFLARFAEGWRVTAAGCRPPSDGDEAAPHDCAVRGE